MSISLSAKHGMNSKVLPMRLMGMTGGTAKNAEVATTAALDELTSFTVSVLWSSRLMAIVFARISSFESL